MKQKKTFDGVAEADVVVNYVNSRFKKGLGTNIFVIGLSGTGKSSSCIRMGEIIMEKRGTNPQLFIIDSLLGLINAIMKSNEGDILVIEEVSVLFPSRRAMTGENVAVGKIFDTIRKKMLCIISNAPLWNSIDSNMKAMAHILVETLRILKGEGVVVSKFFRIQTNPSSGKIYKHKMTRKGKEITRMITKMPNQDRWDKYEQGKDDFMKELYEQLKHQEKKKKDKMDKEMGKHMPIVKDLTKRELEAHVLYNIKKLTQEEVAQKMGVSQPRIVKILQNIINKGQSLKEINNITL